MIGDDSKLKELIQQLTLELRASEARFHNIVAISTDGIVIVDGFGTILFVNPAAISLFGRKAVKLLGEQFGFPIVAGATTELDIANRQGKGTVAEMRVVATEWEGKPAYLANLRDITERIFAELEIKTLNMNLAEKAEELEAANQELEAFNYTVAHDLAQPLNALSMCCQSIKLLCGDQLQVECLSYVEDALKATLSMDHLIKDLLKFSRTGRVELHLEVVDLSEQAHEVAKLLKLTEPERQVDFQIADGVMANGDPNLLRAVMDNLLGNAWKYTGMRDKAVIEFGVSFIEGVPAFYVRDNGSGFDMADADKLIRPFQRPACAEKIRGSGIGFATVERIIRQHGGKVWAESELDKGATFHFTLSAD